MLHPPVIFKRGPNVSGTPLATYCCSQLANHSAMTFVSKRMGTSWVLSHIGHNYESILDGNGFPLGTLYLALAYRYYLVWRRHEKMSLCTGSRVNTNYERIASRDGYKFRTVSVVLYLVLKFAMISPLLTIYLRSLMNYKACFWIADNPSHLQLFAGL